MIKDEPAISKEQAAELLGVTVDTLEPIEQAVERYLADMREQRTGLDWSLAEGKSEEYAARLLVRHIEANRSA